MGLFSSKSSSTSSTTNNSSTENTSAPISQNGNDTLALTKSKLMQGGSGNVNGSLTLGAGAVQNTLDGGAIGRAFDFGTQAIVAMLETTKQAKQATTEAGNAALSFANSANNAAKPEVQNNKTIMILGAVVIAYIISKGYMK